VEVVSSHVEKGIKAIPLEILGERKYRAIDDVEIIQYLKGEGAVHTKLKKNFLCDGRSGGWLVDLLLPNVGDQYYRRGWGGHDGQYAFAAYCKCIGVIPPVSFELANSLYRQTNTLPRRLGGGGFSKPRSWAAWEGVQTKFGLSAYEKIDGFDEKNFGLTEVTWEDK